MTRSQESDPSNRKMGVVFEEVFENANDLLSDPNFREERFPVSWYPRVLPSEEKRGS